ncbi:hypothetical protein R5R35_009073 [Gryllus longicercus]|uniref:Uncharacterized protein n=1 Tax=Gryllus longicercus TaxID=2509291 RepID=A0AAN9VYM0_9ORTH
MKKWGVEVGSAGCRLSYCRSGPLPSHASSPWRPLSSVGPGAVVALLLGVKRVRRFCPKYCARKNKNPKRSPGEDKDGNYVDCEKSTTREEKNAEAASHTEVAACGRN